MLLMLTLERLLEGLRVSVSFPWVGFKRQLSTFEVFQEERHVLESGTQKLVTALDSAYKYRNSWSNSATICPRKWVTRPVCTWLQSQVKLQEKKQNTRNFSSQSAKMPSMDFNIPVMDCYPICVLKLSLSRQVWDHSWRWMCSSHNYKRAALKWLLNFSSGSPALPSPWQELCSHVLTSATRDGLVGAAWAGRKWGTELPGTALRSGGLQRPQEYLRTGRLMMFAISIAAGFPNATEVHPWLNKSTPCPQS